DTPAPKHPPENSISADLPNPVSPPPAPATLPAFSPPARSLPPPPNLRSKSPPCIHFLMAPPTTLAHRPDSAGSPLPPAANRSGDPRSPATSRLRSAKPLPPCIVLVDTIPAMNSAPSATPPDDIPDPRYTPPPIATAAP